MFNCIESSALMDLCRALELPQHGCSRFSMADDVYVVKPGTSHRLDAGYTAACFKLSDYLLATALVDVKEA